MSEDLILDDESFEQLLDDQQHAAVLTALARINSSIQASDDELVKAIREESKNIAAYISKLPTPQIEAPAVTVHTDPAAFVKAVAESTATLSQGQKRIEDLLQELIELRKADVELIAHRNAAQCIERVVARIMYKKF